jgi:hypothetical protein
MALFRRTTQTPRSEPTKELPETMPTRFQAVDARATGHETTYQSSRGGWLKPHQKG